MFSHITASLSHTPTTTTTTLSSFSPTTIFRHRFLFSKRLLKYHPKTTSFSTNCSMESPTVDSVSDGLKKQSLISNNDKIVKKKLCIEDLNWDHSFVRELPGDPRSDVIPREVLHACYSKVSPSVKVENPQLVAWSESVAEILDLDPKEFERPDFPLLFSGAAPLVGGMPYAQCYGGHQFGMWAGQLGDGRAITLGELVNLKSQRWELQLKGAGKTPYSRFADGLAVLRSSIQEFFVLKRFMGFTHGVMNTDNMSVLGLTIDYGPCGFLDAFDPSFTPNTTDLPGRWYCFSNQPDVGVWNIAQFVSTLSSANLINEKEADYAIERYDRYDTKFMDDYQAVMTKKLGLPKYDKQLISKLLTNYFISY